MSIYVNALMLDTSSRRNRLWINLVVCDESGYKKFPFSFVVLSIVFMSTILQAPSSSYL